MPILQTQEYITQLNYCKMMSDKLFDNLLVKTKTPPDRAKADIVHLRRELMDLSKLIKYTMHYQ